MPGENGMGPEIRGPMTGKGSGSCMLRFPDNQDESINGFAGEGAPVRFGENPVRVKEEFDMPRGDGTGPAGAGPMTGRMRGFCVGPGAYENLIREPPFAFAGGAVGGRGRRNQFVYTGLKGWQRSGGFGPGRGAGWFSPQAPATYPESSLETLKAQAGYLERALEGIKQRIEQLESEGKQ